MGRDQSATPFNQDRLSDPDDQGLSLDELSQAYAALVRKGADPYPNESLTHGEAGPDEPPVAAVELETESRESDDQGCEISPQTILEAILFVGHPTEEPLTSERIAGLMRGVRPGEIDDHVVDLNEQYQMAGAPYSIISDGPGYRLSLLPEFATLRDVFYGRIREARLSQAAIDVLAIVAYHQPIPLAEIDRLRGKPSGAIAAQLLRRELLELERTAEDRAKPRYRTSARFLELFGLDGLADLPQNSEN